jgi:cytochrome c oxidase subunit 2
MTPPPRIRRSWALRGLVLGVAVVALTGCGAQQSPLAPKSHQSTDIARLFWWMMGIAWAGLALVVGMMVFAWWHAHKRPGHGEKEGEHLGFRVVVGAGVVFPIILIAALFVVSDIFVIQTTQAPAKTRTRLTVEVTGHQWWWEVRYPGTTAVTANEIHIPVRTPVRVDVRTADVIHSFWVPRLNRTIDAMPGRINSIELYADAVGRYRGQCDEFCGLQHAHMAFYVYADPPAVFRRWLAHEAKPATASGPGAAVFANGSCANCHTIRGTSASADVGPDLTHLQSRTTIGALTRPNTPADLREWITDSQHAKPGNQMPNIQLSGTQLDQLVSYLEALR